MPDMGGMGGMGGMGMYYLSESGESRFQRPQALTKPPIGRLFYRPTGQPFKFGTESGLCPQFTLMSFGVFFDMSRHESANVASPASQNMEIR